MTCVNTIYDQFGAILLRMPSAVSYQQEERLRGQASCARASVLTSEQRTEMARNAVRARWIKAGKLKDVPVPTEAPGTETVIVGPALSNAVTPPPDVMRTRGS